MHIIIDKELKGGDYYLDFVVAESTEADKADFKLQLEKFGKVAVDFGGTFTEEVDEVTTNEETGETTTTTKTVTLFKFNENLREINDELKYSRVFKKSQYGDNAKKFANLYAYEMDTRISSALEALKNKTDDFSSPDIDIHY